MDPDANIREQTSIIRHALRAGWAPEARARLAELSAAYAGWRANGGYQARPILLSDLRNVRSYDQIDTLANTLHL